MIPDTEILTTPIEDTDHPNDTYQSVVDPNLVIGNEVYRNRINGSATGLLSVEQAIYLILGTERYKFPIYSWDYGIELVDLYGKPMPYVMAELPERIKEALTMDNRIEDVTDFKFTRNGKKLSVSFTVITTTGNITSGLEVEV